MRAIIDCLVIIFVCLGTLLASSLPSQGQIIDDKAISKLESNLRKQEGLPKLRSLNILTQYHQGKGSRKGLKFARDASDLADELNRSLADRSRSNLEPLLRAYFQLGEIYHRRNNPKDAISRLELVDNIGKEMDEDRYQLEIDVYLEADRKKIANKKESRGGLGQTLKDLNLGKTITSASQGISGQTEIALGEMSEKKGELDKAIEHYEKAIELYQRRGSKEKINDLTLKIALILEQQEKYVDAQSYLTDAIVQMEEDLQINEKSSILDSLTRGDLDSTIKPDSLRTTQDSLKNLSDRFAREMNFEKSLSYYKMYQALTLEVKADSMRALTEQEQKSKEIVMLKQQKRIADLNVEAAEEEQAKLRRFRNSALLIALVIFVGTLISLFFYNTKRKQHRKLTIAYRDLDKTRGKLVSAEKRITKLLQQQVSGDIAHELLLNDGKRSGERLFVCIMFLDIRDFTPMAERLSPEELISYQNNVFGFMIDIVQKNKGNINQLLGDGFMATFGAPVSHGNDCQNAYQAALEIIRETKARNAAGIIQKTKLGIGLHAGYVVTGNVGTEVRKQYSVTGNPVIIASRIEQLNKTYKSQLIITEEVYNKLDKPLQLKQPFLEVEVKGRSNPVRILKIA